MKRKWMYPLISGVVGVLLFGIGVAGSSWCRGILQDQDAAQRWEEDYLQISCYLSQDLAVTPEGIGSIRDAINGTLEEELGSSEVVAWYDVYSCDGGTVTVLAEKPGKKQIDLTLVSESYFRMHQLPLLSGNRLSAADRSTRRVVLNEEAAWQLYGSVNIAGKTLTMSQMLCEVAGVVKMPDDFATRKVQGEQSPEIFMLYCDYATGQTPALAITAYEAVLPELVDGYGMQLMETAVENVAGGMSATDDPTDGGETENTLSDDRYLLVQNTDRFSLSQVWHYLTHHDEYLVRRSAIPYPDGENAALLVLHRIAMLTLVAAFGILLMLIAIVYTVIVYRKNWRKTIRRILRRMRRGIKTTHTPQTPISKTERTGEL